MCSWYISKNARHKMAASAVLGEMTVSSIYIAVCRADGQCLVVWFNINRIRRCILNESISVRSEMMILLPLNKIKKYKIAFCK